MAAAQVLGVKPSLADKMGGAVRLASGEQTSCKPVHVLGPRVLVRGIRSIVGIFLVQRDKFVCPVNSCIRLAQTQVGVHDFS